MNRPIAWITGASSGIGRELALTLIDKGWHVVATARNAQRLDRLAALPQTGGELTPLAADVTDAGAMARVAARIESELGPLQLAVFNAGDYEPMAVGELDVALIRRLMEVNYLGVVHGVAAVLPAMQARGGGEILINASVAGYRGLPYAAPYGASKAALIAFAESLRTELQDSGVALRVINPGFVKTPLTAKNRFTMPMLITPQQAAAAIAGAVGGKGFEITFPKRFTYILKLLRMLPYALYFPLIRRMTGVDHAAG
jgi:short-subunit dehydrogenase